jgi:hypothetical protein
MIRDRDTRCQGCQKVLDAIERMLDWLEHGLAVDFSRKVEATL